MPRNGSGTAIPPSGVNPVSPGTTITSNWANTTVNDTYNELTNSLPRDGQAPMTAPLKIVDGSASVPGLSFNSETATGLYRPSASAVAITVGGVEVTRCLSTGSVLIGQTSDDGINKLQVTGGAKITGSVSADNATLALGTAALPSLAFTGDLNTGIYSPGADQLSVSTGGAARVAVGATGNIGMPTVDSVARLRLDANDPARGILALVRNALNTTGAQIQLSQSGVGDWAFGVVPATNAFAFYSGRTTAADGAERMRLDASGNLGIGTTPSSRLHVSGDFQQENANYIRGKLAVGTQTRLFGMNASNALYIGSIDAAHSGGTLFVNNGATQMALDSGGNFLVGNSATAATDAVVFRNTSSATVGIYRALDVTSVGAAGATLTFGALNGATQTPGAQLIGVLNNPASSGYLTVYTRNASAMAEAARFTPSKQLLINRTTDSGLGLLQVAGNGDFAPDSGTASVHIRGVAGAPAALEISANAVAAGSGFSLIQDNAGVTYLYNRQNAALVFGTNNNARMTLSATGALTPQTDVGQNLGGPSNRWATAFASGLSDGATASGMLINSSGTAVQLAAGSAWQSLSFFTNNTQKLAITSDGRLYGTALHNNAGAVTGTTNQYIASGTYTPTFANVNNVSSFTGISTANWIRVGNVVHVAGAVSADFTTAGPSTNWTATLPIASGVLNGDLHGVAVANTQTDSAATIFNGTNVALFSVSNPANNGLHVYRYTFTYEVV